jgi:hypothetical protein
MIFKDGNGDGSISDRYKGGYGDGDKHGDWYGGGYIREYKNGDGDINWYGYGDGDGESYEYEYPYVTISIISDADPLLSFVYQQVMMRLRMPP